MKRPLLYSLLVIVMMIWGFNIIAIKVIVSTLPTITITALRVFMAFLALLPILYYKKMFRVLSKKEMAYVLGIALTGVLGHQVFMSVGLNYTSATNGGVILGTVPIATSIAAILFLGDKLTISRVLGLLFGFSGVTFVMLSNASLTIGFSIGDLYMCIVVVLQALSFVLIKRLSESVEVIYITGIAQLIGFGMLLSLSFVIEPNGISLLKYGSTTVWLLFLGSGLIATGLGHLLYNYAIQQLGASKSALFLNLSPFFAILGSALFLGEHIFAGQWIGFGLIVIGVIFGAGMLEQINIRSLLMIFTKR
ncbi:DMT family transporter [Sporosarcina sp. E16_3]|uniref:DMT family transporter n=1 Tax=Sporosarcina sp. E16_3 TaxID=2789293 RepID=UPI001A90CF4F|nr:DMT family transporter [Sporosarcina sp. E16_3]MBO0603381.1 DMT family transporter [Sporosarcina sp. E16_3]